MSLAATAGTAIVLMATVRSILGSRARNTAPIAPRPSSATISYRPNWCTISIAQIALGIVNMVGDRADDTTGNQQFTQPPMTISVLSLGAKQSFMRCRAIRCCPSYSPQTEDPEPVAAHN